MRVGSRVKVVGQDRHRLREPLTGAVGTVVLFKERVPAFHGPLAHVEFDRDNPRDAFSDSWWIEAHQLQEVR